MPSAVNDRRLEPAGTMRDAARRRRPRRPHRLGSALIAVGSLLSIVAAADVAYGLAQQHQLDESWRQWQQTHTVPSGPQTPDPASLHPVAGVDFVLSLPKLGYSAAVREGTDTASLATSPGHYPATAWPGQFGNIGVAAHNGYWIHFDQLKPGDLVVVQTRWGTFRYVVDNSRIVAPTDRTVLVPTHDRRLTMTTCWPLWAGAFASQRLIVTAFEVTPARAASAPPPAGASSDPEVWVVAAVLAGVVVVLCTLWLNRKTAA